MQISLGVAHLKKKRFEHVMDEDGHSWTWNQTIWGWFLCPAIISSVIHETKTNFASDLIARDTWSHVEHWTRFDYYRSSRVHWNKNQQSDLLPAHKFDIFVVYHLKPHGVAWGGVRWGVLTFAGTCVMRLMLRHAWGVRWGGVGHVNVRCQGSRLAVVCETYLHMYIYVCT